MWQLIKCHRIRKTPDRLSVNTKLMPIIALLILLSFGTVVGQTTEKASDNRARLDNLRAEGYAALYNLDYEGARKSFRELIQLAPDSPAGPQCFAASLWVQQLNESWELKSTLYSDKVYKNEKPKVDSRQVEEFRKWTRRAKQLAEARLRRNARDVEALYFLGATEGLEAAY